MSDIEETPLSRRRGTELEIAIFDATYAELQAVGYRKLSFDGIAARASTSKAVLYRRWGNRQELVIAALEAKHDPYPGEIPDTGSLSGDLLGLFKHIDESWKNMPVDIGLGLLTDTMHNATQHDYFLKVVKQRSLDILAPALRRAQSRGEISAAALSERIITLPFDLIRHEVMTTGKPATPAAVGEIIDTIYVPLLRAYKQD